VVVRRGTAPARRASRHSRPGALALAAWLSLATALSARAESPSPEVGDAVVRDARGATVVLAELTRAHKFTVVTFYGVACPCFAAHVERLRQLASELGPQGVGFLVVDSERHAKDDPPVPRQVAPGLPIFRDEGGTLARRLGASYATESYVLDATGHIRYRGGIDSDRKYLRPDTQPYLRQALLKLLAGQGPAFATTKALGCALRLL
jgi:hypothetical protein